MSSVEFSTTLRPRRPLPSCHHPCVMARYHQPKLNAAETAMSTPLSRTASKKVVSVVSAKAKISPSQPLQSSSESSLYI